MELHADMQESSQGSSICRSKLPSCIELMVGSVSNDHAHYPITIQTQSPQSMVSSSSSTNINISGKSQNCKQFLYIFTLLNNIFMYVYVAI